MKTYEYHVISMANYTYLDLEGRLNAYGKDGWKVIHVEADLSRPRTTASQVGRKAYFIVMKESDISD